MKTTILSVLIFLLGGCAASPSLDFALIGDMPYDGRQEKEFANLMKDIDAADLAFVVHNGDFWWDGAAWTEKAGGLPPCSDEAFNDRLAMAQRSRHPYILAAGDNEWADCHRAKPRTYDPVERLAKLRQMFFRAMRVLQAHKADRQSETTRTPLPGERTLDPRERGVPHAAYHRQQQQPGPRRRWMPSTRRDAANIA
jgi:hypothetical protein